MLAVTLPAEVHVSPALVLRLRIIAAWLCFLDLDLRNAV